MPVSGNQPSVRPTVETQSYEEASRAAAEHKHQFNPKERADYVRAMVSRTLEYQREHKTIDEIKERLPEFARDYKHLFDVITSPDGYDAGNLQVMITMLEHMNNGNLTQHDASVIVGKRLYSKYKTQTNQTDS